METREQLSKENYQQAVKFSQYFANDLRQEFESEAEQRYQFEKTQFEQQLQNSQQKQPLVKKSIISLCAIFLLGSIYYWQSGRYQVVQEGLQLHQQFQEQTNPHQGISKNDRYILSLQNQLRENPNNGELWYELGQAYALNNEFDSALICYGNAEKLLGKKASILSAMATANYYDNKQRMSPEIKELLKQALALDKNESASLLLLASDSFLNNDYQQALGYWRQVLDGNNESIDRRAIIQSMAMARQMLEGQNK
ncbi:cytochrome C biogenesis protein [Mannheimia sp. AT1]|uniref:Cytochrome C biogenesis protein n=1 Tax=Mannheimia cairinae TaxID=3025936 RepID=A0ABT5MP31_9PAST|nr:cytochrome C biogenesis protein [Mannheimia cairinae]MDD0823935.1 cytochrome C biogenesis protein [Mannheimia cairinae]MDD0825251.1 cytochrome C biogenesis protein [Mannheimia cairinae]